MAIEWDYGIVAFLDVLGFASFVETDARAPSPQHLDRLISCLAEVRRSTPAGGLDLRSFSDSVVLSGALSLENVADLVTSVVGLQRIFANRAVLVRGAIAFGKHFADRDSIYSEALIRAYTLERDHARFPRVLVDHELLDWFLHHEHLGEPLSSCVCQALLRDRDGRVFIHYLDARLIQKHAELLKTYESNRITASVLEKLQWLAAYHNYVALRVDSNAVVQGPLVAGFRPLSMRERSRDSAG